MSARAISRDVLKSAVSRTSNPIVSVEDTSSPTDLDRTLVQLQITLLKD